MNYSQALRYLSSFTDLEKLSQLPKNPFFNLRRMEHLLKASDHPEKKFFPILIAGTAGKGSTGFFLESLLKANGIRTGYYHSPHVEDPRERIRLDGTMTSQKCWADGLSETRKLLRKAPLPAKLGVLTYFEILTFLAILSFAKAGVQIGIFEIGLGGRLDATNVLKAPLVILTRIHLDHEAFLGRTIAKIAAEKAGIIKSRGHVVTGEQFPEALRVIRQAVRKEKGTLWQAGPVKGIPLGLAGEFQKMNAGVALKAAEVLSSQFGFPLVYQRSLEGLRSRNWTGRMEPFRRNRRTFILDGAHNPISVQALVRSLRKNRGGRKDGGWLVFGAMNDKNSREMLQILSLFFSKVILTGVSGSRAKPVSMLVREAQGLFPSMFMAGRIPEALDLLRKSPDREPVIITGSFYLVGEARRILNRG